LRRLMGKYGFVFLLAVAALIPPAVICSHLALGAEDEGVKAPEQSEARKAAELEARLVAQLRLLSALYLKNDQGDEALKCEEKIVALLLDDPVALGELVQVAFQVGQYGKARDALNKLNDLTPNTPVILHALAVCHKAAGDAAKHKEFFDKALAAADKNVNAHFEAVKFFDRLGMMDVVYAEMEKIIAMPLPEEGPPAGPRLTAMERMATYLKEEGKYSEAARMYGRLSAELEMTGPAAAPSVRSAASEKRFCEGKQQETENKLQAAREKYEDSVRLWSGNIDAQGGLYKCLKALNKPDEAKKAFAAAEMPLLADIKQGGENPNPAALNSLAWFYAVAEEKADEGIKLSREAVKAAPSEAALADTLAELYYVKAKSQADPKAKEQSLRDAVKYSNIAYKLPKETNVPYYRKQKEKMEKALEQFRKEAAEHAPPPPTTPQQPCLYAQWEYNRK